MTKLSFVKAVRHEKKLRMALHGPSGSGKTYTALEIATGIGGKIALIDTERGSASLYGDKFDFDTLELEYFGVDNYVNAINTAAEADYNVLVIDSLSHAWSGLGGVLDAVNNTRGNTFTDGWGKVGTPQQNRLIDAILKCPCHVIATLRVKTDYEVEKDERGKVAPKKVGLAPVQRDGVEYEFDIVGSLSQENTLTVEKTRMIDLAGKIIPKPDRRLGKTILEWLNYGAPEPVSIPTQLNIEPKMPVAAAIPPVVQKTEGNEPKHWGDLMQIAADHGKVEEAKKLKAAGVDYMQAWHELFPA